MSVKKALTRGDHEANRLKKVVKGHEAIIRDLQEALRIERDRVMRAEANAAGAQTTAKILREIARATVAELREESRAKYLALFPMLGEEEENGTL